ncbi:MAG: TonB family protein [Myxococcota bacterium]|nr:TonB family protein [Myxococcota bacterium]
MFPKPLIAAATMLAGSTGVFSLLVGLNLNAVAPPPVQEKPAIALDAAPKPPPPKKKERPRKARPKKSTPSARAPLPNLGAGLSGLDLGLPGPAMGELTEGLLGDASDVVMTQETVDSAPIPVAQAQPSYPQRARSKNIEGYVTLSLRVSQDGSVEELRILDAQPSGVFEQAAKEAVAQWRFEPATYEGLPVATRMQQTLHFRLQ